MATYYVATTGNDSNPGTAGSPWATFYHAAQTAVAGDTVLFADGTYNESSLTRFPNAGTALKRITFQAQNNQLAVISYGSVNNYRCYVAKPFITIDGFEFVTTNGAGGGSNQLVTIAEGADYAIVKNCKIHGSYEDGIKLSQVSHVLVYNNNVYDVEHEGIDSVNGSYCVIAKNYVHDCGRNLILLKGGSRYIDVVGNLVSMTGSTRALSSYAVGIGGTTGYASTWDPAGYEAYHIICRKNTVQSDGYSGAGSIQRAFVMAGAINCKVYDNTVTGPPNYFSSILDGGDPTNSSGQGAWSCKTNNPRYYNNTSTYHVSAIQTIDTPEGSIVDSFNSFTAA